MFFIVQGASAFILTLQATLKKRSILCFHHTGSLSLRSNFHIGRPSVSIGIGFFRHHFRYGEGLKRSDSESDTRRIR